MHLGNMLCSVLGKTVSMLKLLFLMTFLQWKSQWENRTGLGTKNLILIRIIRTRADGIKVIFIHTRDCLMERRQREVRWKRQNKWEWIFISRPNTMFCTPDGQKQKWWSYRGLRLRQVWGILIYLAALVCRADLHTF